jgi:hypothetical protein
VHRHAASEQAGGGGGANICRQQSVGMQHTHRVDLVADGRAPLKLIVRHRVLLLLLERRNPAVPTHRG